MDMKLSKNIAVIDTETDPFKFNRVPKPFCCEFYTDKISEQFWGEDCMMQLASFCEKLPDDYLIYAHNGGKFDFHFMHDYLDNPIKIINARIVSAKFFHHTLRDSLAIMPVPLRDYEKVEFDYTKLERPIRQKHKTEILDYLHSDCMNLFKMVSTFVERFGPKLTVGSMAIGELRKIHKFDRMDQESDQQFRPYYFGGRVECFESGIIKGPFQVYDVNSMYPAAMRNFKHPHNNMFVQQNEIPDDYSAVYFVHFKGKNRGALPVKTEKGLSFNVLQGEFFACSHEIKVALKYGLIDIDKIISVHVATETTSFGAFVDRFYAEKVQAGLVGDKLGKLFAKFILNSAYGKFGQSPDNFKDYMLVRDFGDDFQHIEKGYAIEAEFPSFEIWSKPSEIFDHSFYDVSVAASITSAARAMLLGGLQNAQRPIYCDTDSIICQKLRRTISETELGDWKFEGEYDFAAIAGKKMYAMYNNGDLTTKKLASKGAKLELMEIIDICKGNKFHHRNIAPTFSLKKAPYFVERSIRTTSNILDESLI